MTMFCDPGYADMFLNLVLIVVTLLERAAAAALGKDTLIKKRLYFDKVFLVK